MSFPEEVPFEVISEKWNTYDLGNEIILKAKIVLVKILKPSGIALEEVPELIYNAPVVIAVYAPLEKKGTPETKELTPALVSKSISEDLDPVPLEENINEYKLEDKGFLRLRLMLTRVAMTDIFSADSSPVVAVSHQVVPQIRLPRKSTRERSKKKTNYVRD